MQKQQRNILLYLLTASAVTLGIFLPGALLHRQSQVGIAQVSPVPEEYYAAYNFATSYTASAKMTINEKLRLISGRWESTISEAAPFEMKLKEYEAVELAKSGVNMLYQQKRYPAELYSEYGNWFVWSAVPYKAVDSTFQTYAAYYWVVQFERYDHTELHTVCLLEEGAVFLAQSEFGSDNELFDQYAGGGFYTWEVQEEGTAAESERLSPWLVYPELHTDRMSWRVYIPKPYWENGLGADNYVVAQAWNRKGYAIWFVPD